MSWGSLNFWRRASPYNSFRGTPQVSEGDFSYLVGDGTTNNPTPRSRRQESSIDPNDESAPDILILRHLGVTYPLHFNAYAIDDGLTIGQVRQRAAEQTGASDPRCIRMLYKGKLLREDWRPCKDEGLKQQSQIMCVVSKVQPGDESVSDTSSEDNGTTVSKQPSRQNENSRRPQPKTKSGCRRNRPNRPNPNLSTSRSSTDLEVANQPDSNFVALPVVDSQPSNPLDLPFLNLPTDQRPSSRRSFTPSPAPNLGKFRTSHEKLDALVGYFRNELLPLCRTYISSPPNDARTRESECEKLCETILDRVILKADEIEGTDVRNARKALIREAQAILTQLDKAKEK